MSQTRESFDWLQFHLTLKRAGITRQRAAFQSRIGILVENVAREILEMSGSESYYDWMMTGSFVEGWGNHLFRLDGVTGTDSDIDWSQVVNHKIYHLKDTCKSVVDCINRKDYKLENGHIQVKNCSQQPAFETKRHGLRPATDECHAYPCCSYPLTVVDQDGRVNKQEIHPKFRDLLEKQFDNENPVDDVHFVRASVPGQLNQMRLSCTRQERTIMSQLSTVHGQLFTVLKYLFKTNASEQSDEIKIINHLKSFHAKTLLMTLLRDEDSWMEEGQDEDDNEKAAAELLKKLVERSLESLKKSATDNAGSGEIPPRVLDHASSRDASGKNSPTDNAGSGEIPPRVLDHALLRDAGLYLKVKTKDKDKGKVSDKDLHTNALKEMTKDLHELIENRLETILSKYKQQIERTLDKRGIPKVGNTPGDAETEPARQLTTGPETTGPETAGPETAGPETTGPETSGPETAGPEIARPETAGPETAGPGTAGAQESLRDPTNLFLFVPLLMLPRISLENLLDEMNRKKTQQNPPGTSAQALPEVPLDTLTQDTPERAPGELILKRAYINVWRILTSLATQKNGSSQQEDTQTLKKVWDWIKKQDCLQTTHQCLEVMKLMKERAPDSKIIEALNADHQPVRWISMGDDLNEVLQKKNCVWAFHYFIRPNVEMNFHYLDEVQAVWKSAKTFKNKKDQEVVIENDCSVRKKWLTHLKVKKDSKKSRQPSLTVNFDGLLDSFRRCMRKREAGWKGSKSEKLDGGDFLAFMDNCLFDPRESKQK